MLSSSPVVAGGAARARVYRATASYRLDGPLNPVVTYAAPANEELRPLTNPNTNLGLPWTIQNLSGEPISMTDGRFRDAMHARDARRSFARS